MSITKKQLQDWLDSLPDNVIDSFNNSMVSSSQKLDKLKRILKEV